MAEKYSSLNQYLESKLVPYKEYDLSSLEADKNFSPEYAIKALLLRTDSEYTLAVMSLTQRLDSSKYKKLLSAQRLRFATEEELVAVMSCVPGECHPFGRIRGIQTTIDSKVCQQDEVYFSAGVSNMIIKTALQDYLRIEKPDISNISK